MNDGELAIEWIETLAKDEFNQTRRQLEDAGCGRSPGSSTGFCCLGVARWTLGMEATDQLYDEFKENGCFINLWRFAPDLSNEEMKELGLTPTGSDRCINMNDEKKLTFPEIAKQLVSEPGGFFLTDVADAIEEHFYSL